MNILRKCAFVVLICIALCGAAKAQEQKAQTPMQRYIAWVLESCDRAETRIPEMTALAETVADRHIAGGSLGVIWEPQSATGPQGPQYEIKGRSGGMTAFDVSLSKKMAGASRDRDVAIIGWQRAPDAKDLEIVKRYHQKFFVIAFGPRDLPELAPLVPFTDAWIDTGLGPDDRVVPLPDGARAGRGNALLNVFHSWAFLGEVIAACTRRGAMPTMLQSHSVETSKAWNGRYRNKLAWHDDLTVAPIPAGTLGRRYLEQIRVLVRAFETTQSEAVGKSAALIADELAAGRKTLVAQTGHTTYEYVGQYEDRVWATPTVLYDSPGRIAAWPRDTAENALVLRLGYSGEDRKLMDLMRQNKQRVLLVASGKDPRPDFQIPTDVLAFIEMGWDFGDAVVAVDNYPIRIFPPSGAMQLIAYEAINVEVLARLAKTEKP